VTEEIKKDNLSNIKVQWRFKNWAGRNE